MTLLHDLPDFGDLIVATARAQDPPLDPSLVEKDYWIMHALWGLQVQGFAFELKGGTSLSKALGSSTASPKTSTSASPRRKGC